MTIDITAEREEAFWANIRKTDDHWLWMGYVDKNSGQGKVTYDAKTIGVHRVSWILDNQTQTLLDHYQVHHTCGVKHCVRPSHLKMVKTKPRKSSGSRKSQVTRGIRYTGLRSNAPVDGTPKWRAFEDYVRDLTSLTKHVELMSAAVTSLNGKIEKLADIVEEKPVFEVDMLDSRLGPIEEGIDRLTLGMATVKNLQHAMSKTVEDYCTTPSVATSDEQASGSLSDLPEEPGDDPPENLVEKLMAAFQYEIGLPKNPNSQDMESLSVIFDVALEEAATPRAAVDRFMSWLARFKQHTAGYPDEDRSPQAFAKAATR